MATVMGPELLMQISDLNRKAIKDAVSAKSSALNARFKVWSLLLSGAFIMMRLMPSTLLRVINRSLLISDL